MLQEEIVKYCTYTNGCFTSRME